jgi:DUF4097 and DUF4098 domain-containing protein YvlB
MKNLPRRIVPGLLAVLSALIAAGSLLASVPLNEHREVTPDALIEVSVVAGTVQVTGWDKAEMELTGSLSDDRLKLEITGGKDHLKIEVRMRNDENHYKGESDLALKVPKGSRIDVETVSGEITATDLKAQVRLNTVSGRLEVKGNPQEVKLSTVSGNIVLNDGESLEAGDFNTVSGSIEARVRFRPGGNFRFETVSGSITLRIPADTNADFQVSTFSGGITSDFGDKPAKTNQYLPSQELEFSTGKGGARVKVNALSGHVRILKD